MASVTVTQMSLSTRGLCPRDTLQVHTLRTSHYLNLPMQDAPVLGLWSLRSNSNISAGQNPASNCPSTTQAQPRQHHKVRSLSQNFTPCDSQICLQPCMQQRQRAAPAHAHMPAQLSCTSTTCSLSTTVLQR
jgi:hypothetical protein